MLTSEFSQELGALIRSLQDRVRLEPALLEVTHGEATADLPSHTAEAKAHIDRAIIRLVALRLSL